MTHRPFHSGRLLIAAMVVAAMMPFSSSAQTPETSSIALRVGQHGNYSRVVFDFPKLTAYSVTTENGDIALTFDTTASVPTAAPSTPLVLGIKKGSAENNAQKILIDIPDGATYKHYRLLRKVVVDIEGAGTEMAAAPKPAPAPAPAPAATPAPQPPKTVEAPKPAPAPALIPAPPPPQQIAEAPKPAPVPEEPKKLEANSLTTEEVKKAVPPEVIVDQVETAATATPAAPAMQEEEPTKLTISGVEPTNLSVFTRFGTLWVVMDSKAAGAIPPDIKGPETEALGKPKVLRFNGGVAYRYTMPTGGRLSVSKRSLTWDISITKTKRPQAGGAQLAVIFDSATQKAKLMAELQGAGRVLEIEDPVAGDKLYVVPASSPESRVEQSRRFPDVEVFPSAIGMALRPLKDGIKVNRIESFVMVTSQDGIDATPGAEVDPSAMQEAEEDDGKTRLFDFPSWRQGGISRLNENRRVIENRLATAKTPDERSETLMRLALLYFANDFGQETLGVLRLIESENEEMPKNPNFIAVRGAAAALAGHYQDAIKDLSNPALQQHPEVGMWIGYAAAATEQWHMANRSFPKNNYFLDEYPPEISVPFTIYMAESALRLGDTDTAKGLLHSLDVIERESGHNAASEAHHQAAIAYLKGEAARQNGEFDEAIRLWTPVAHGLDRLYHAKASLALATLQLQENKINLKQAIDTLDSLRFAWRGDGLEVQIMTALGDLKIKNKQVLAGLQDLKSAAAVSVALNLDPKPIEDDMSRTVYDLFAKNGAQDLSPLEAVTIYSEFEKYLPQGEDATTAALAFADYLLRMDLLDKAAKLMEDQLQSLPETQVADVGAKLAATYLLDDRPSEAINALGKTGSAAGNPQTMLERGLLKARAQSQLNLTDDAIATLTPLASEDARRLKADVLWRARKWDGAAEAIESLLPPPEEKLDEEKARLVVNAAVAWKLAGNTPKLQDLRSRYQKSMLGSPLAPTFGVVTRDSDDISLSDRQTILKLAGEVDMFAGFLNSYKSTVGKGS